MNTTTTSVIQADTGFATNADRQVSTADASQAINAGETSINIQQTAQSDIDYSQTVGDIEVANAKMSMRNVDVFYGDKQAIFDVDLDIAKNEVIAMIGPSGCGKSTFLRCLNRMNDTIEECRVSGSLMLEEQNIYDPSLDVVPLRARVGMVFQKPNPFPKSIYENVAKLCVG